MPEINDNLIKLLGGLYLALAVGTVARVVALRNSDAQLKQTRMGSLKVWWTLAVLLSVASVFGRPGAALMLAAGSLLGLHEFLKLIGIERLGRPTIIAAMLTIPLQYLLVMFGETEAAGIVLPAFGLILFSIIRLLNGGTDQYLRTTAGVFWAVLLLVYNLSHGVLLFRLSGDALPAVGLAGWFLFVVIITELDDIAQALVGRRIGKHKITPTISPNKTWEGFAGGVVTSVLLAVLLTPWLTTFPSVFTLQGIAVAVSAGLLIVVGAFFGDINMSAVKRDAGVKDGSNILPGMGGIIDRVDSLTFTAPVFYYFVRFVTACQTT